MRQRIPRRRRSNPAGGRKGTGGTEAKPSRPEPRVLTTMRLRQSLRRDLEAAAARNRRSVADVAQELLEEADRKSTRLNSSHRCISYAVFCLKNKKTTSTDRTSAAT